MGEGRRKEKEGISGETSRRNKEFAERYLENEWRR